MAVQKLYLLNSAQSKCTAKITKIIGNDVYLDKTVFFAGDAQQTGDSGTIAGRQIIAAKDKNEDVAYTLEDASGLAKNDQVEMEIDFPRRGRLCRLHTAQHIAYYVFEEMFGTFPIKESKVTPESAVIILACKKDIFDSLEQYIKAVNDETTQDTPVVMSNDRANPNKRIWKCKSWSTPCTGTHVKKLSQIGPLIVTVTAMDDGLLRIGIALADDSGQDI